jgi:hypothetical protein
VRARQGVAAGDNLHEHTRGDPERLPLLEGQAYESVNNFPRGPLHDGRLARGLGWKWG